MHLKGLLHRTFDKASADIDKRNHKSILAAAETLCQNKHLSIAALGRCLKSKAKVKNNIKRMDRLFGNRRVQNARSQYYREISRVTLGAIERPAISIDWSGLTPCGAFHLLRASVPVKGRAMTIFEQSYLESEYTKRHVHEDFLEQLRRILPPNCKPIIVTDAGFRNTWFKLVLELGWDYVGRVRHKTQYKIPGTEHWEPIKTLYPKATNKPTFLFESLLAKANSLPGQFYLFKEKAKNRHHKNLRGKRIRCSSSLKHAQGATEPWLLFTSLSKAEYPAQRIVKIYRQRMQIEEAFRDLKNTNNGLNMRHCRSYEKGRLNVALLIALIANFMLWIAGTSAKMRNLQYDFQANTIKSRAVLSNFTLGTQYFQRFGYKINIRDFTKAIQQLNIDCLECL